MFPDLTMKITRLGQNGITISEKFLETGKEVSLQVGEKIKFVDFNWEAEKNRIERRRRVITINQENKKNGRIRKSA